MSICRIRYLLGNILEVVDCLKSHDIRFCVSDVDFYDGMSLLMKTIYGFREATKMLTYLWKT